MKNQPKEKPETKEDKILRVLSDIQKQLAELKQPVQTFPNTYPIPFPTYPQYPNGTGQFLCPSCKQWINPNSTHACWTCQQHTSI